MSAALIAWSVSALRWLRKAAATALGTAARYPWPVLSVFLALLSALFWRGEHKALDRYAAAERDLKTTREAAQTAARTAAAQRAADEQHYRELAQDADTHYRLQTADARSATAAYIRAHRLPPAAASAAAASLRETSGGDSGLPADPAAQAELVAVTAADVSACAADFAYAQAAYEWAASLVD